MSDEAARAGATYTVSLEPIGGARAWTLAWVKGFMMATAALVGWWDRPAIGDLVVRRRVDGSEAIRTGAGDQDEAAHLLAHVQGQLEELGVAEFEAAWGLDAGQEADLDAGSAHA